MKCVVRKIMKNIGLFAISIVLIAGICSCGTTDEKSSVQPEKIKEEKKDTYTFTSESGYSVELPNIYKDKVDIGEYEFDGGRADEFYLISQNEIDETGYLFSISKMLSDDAVQFRDVYGEDSIIGTTKDGAYFYGIMEPTDVQFDQDHQGEYEEMLGYLDSIVQSFKAENFIAGAMPEFTISEEELENYCIEISYDELARYPDSYTGNYVKITGEIYSVIDNANGEDVYCLYMTLDETGLWYEDAVLVYFDNSNISGRLLEGDIVTFYGVYNGLNTSIFGDNEPCIQAYSVEF